MALITQKFTATVTDEADPTTVQEINFTDDAYQNYSVIATSLAPFNHVTYATWLNAPETLIFDATSLATQAGYVIIKTDNPIYLWVGRAPARTADPGTPIDETVTPKLVASRCFIVSGGVTKVYALNPSKDNDTPPLTAHIKTTIVY